MNKIEVLENAVKELETKNFESDVIYFLYKKNITYLFSQSENLVKNSYIEVMEDEESYLLLGEMINDIHNLEYIVNLYETPANDLGINQNVEEILTKVKEHCEKILTCYKNQE
ncbi:MAG: hypothetical protein AB7E37_08490 [Candidatus Altimarinota bacterium]